MRLNKEDITALEFTIEATGFTGKIKSTDCVAFSSADSKENEAVHTRTNEQLLETLIKKDDVGYCIHITGQMRALADPFHRRLCAELANRSNSRFIVIYNIPEQFRQSPEGVGEWNAQRWASKTWVQKLSAMNLIGDALVDVRAYNTVQEIEYSVFGNRYIQLQEKHFDEDESPSPKPKRVWLLNSEKLNGFLTEKAINIINNADDIPEALYKRFFAKVSGVSSQNIMAKLIKEGAIHIEKLLDERLLEFDPDAASNLDILKSIGFIKLSEQNRVSITEDGKQFIGF
ncbi:MAG: hypothetical protein IPN42_04880 [Methylococcaceae bacterium]|nr:hypothetical protein [Methylococcaceae bacterium]